MQSLTALSPATRQSIKAVLTDIDDTLTTDGRLRAAAYGALERLQDSGLIVIPITGRPAGWCDHIARMWPVDGVVGENGAFYFQYDRQGKVMIKRFQASDAERAANRPRPVGRRRAGIHRPRRGFHQPRTARPWPPGPRS